MGVHESIIPAAVATMVPQERRPSAYGLFTAAYGISWFLGSAAIGFLYDVSVEAAVVFCVATGVASLPFFFAVQEERGVKGPREGGRPPLPSRINMISLARRFSGGSYEYDFKIVVGIYCVFIYGLGFRGRISERVVPTLPDRYAPGEECCATCQLRSRYGAARWLCRWFPR